MLLRTRNGHHLRTGTGRGGNGIGRGGTGNWRGGTGNGRWWRPFCFWGDLFWSTWKLVLITGIIPQKSKSATYYKTFKVFSIQIWCFFHPTIPLICAIVSGYVCLWKNLQISFLSSATVWCHTVPTCQCFKKTDAVLKM